MGDNKNDLSRKASERGPKLPRESVKAVGKKLKESYQRMIDQPVPNHFLDLLEQLDKNASANRANAQRPHDPVKPGSKSPSSGSNGGRD